MVWDGKGVFWKAMETSN